MISKELIKNIIIDNQQRKTVDLWERKLSLPVHSGKIVTLAGVRRSGKTYHLFRLMEQLKEKGIPKEKLLFFNFEDERLRLEANEMDLILQAYQELYPELALSESFFFFDEIQESPEWEKFVTRLHDSICTNVFITGSNARLLSQEIATVLRGRSLTIEVYPLSFSEYIQIQSPGLNPYNSAEKAKIIHFFDSFMHQGGFPELIRMQRDFHNKTLQEYFDVMLFRDVVERYQISNSSILKYFCKRVIGASAGEFSVHKIYNELKSQGFKVSKDTLYAYQDYVEAVYLARFVKKWSVSVVKSEGAQRKAYVIDPGLGSALDYKFGLDKGRLLETTVALELLKLGKDILYFNEGNECDFVVSESGKVNEAIQVTLDFSDEKTREREIKGLIECCKMLELKQGIILTQDHSETLVREGIEISVIPVWSYFLP